MIELLEDSTVFPRVFWKPRGSLKAWVGCGDSAPGSLSFGGQAFSPESCRGVWSHFPSSIHFSPSILKQLPWEPTQLLFSLPKLLRAYDTPTFDLWEKMIHDALQKIEKNHLKKVVLARQTTLVFDAPINPFHVLKMLNPLGSQSSLFLLQVDADNTFLGATPERLFSRHERSIFSEALAGTKCQEEEWSPKEFLEIEAVRVFLQEKLLLCCTDIVWHPPQQKQFGMLQHLCQIIQGSLKEKTSDADLLFHLHPTPALGGFPQQEALDYLNAHEPFNRGWFGGPIGLISANETEMVVAIRSALIRGNEMHLFAGTGIVKGSHPKREWEELDRKIDHFLRYL